MPNSLRGVYQRLVWPAAAIESAPKPVRDAWAAHEKAADAAEAKSREAAAARDVWLAADRDDDAAALEAVSAGKPVPPRTKDDKRKAHDDLVRETDALQSLAIRAERHLIGVAREHRDEWFTSIGPEVEASVDRAAASITSTEEALTEAAGLAAVYRWLDHGELDSVPKAVLPGDASQALTAGRKALGAITPTGLQYEKARRAEAERARAEELAHDVGGVQVRRRVR